MARLTKEELEKYRLRLSEWQAPADMLACVDQVTASLTNDEYFTQGGLTFLREGWVAGTFAGAINADEVRLVDGEWPDAEIRVAGTEHRLEIVEADLPGRQRGREYREMKARGNRIEMDPVADWDARAEQIPDALRGAVRAKLKKRYSEPVELLIHLNIGDYRQEQTELMFASATEAARDRFAAVWVLWKRKAYRVWPAD